LPGDHRHHAAGTIPFGTVGKKLLRITSGADAKVEDIRGTQAGIGALAFERSWQVKQKFARLERELTADLYSRTHPLELVCDFGSHLEATGANSRSDGCPQARRIDPEPGPHSIDCFRQNAARGSSPAGMNRGDSTGVRIREQDRKAIRHHHSHGHANMCRSDRIPFASAISLVVPLLYDMKEIGMNLRKRDEPGGCETQGREESAAVIPDPFFRIPRDEPEIQRVPLRRFCPAEPGREAVPHTRQFFEGSTAVKGHPSTVSPDESIRDHDLNSVSRIRSLSIHHAAHQ
jgi:hypothetical protein